MPPKELKPWEKNVILVCLALNIMFMVASCTMALTL